MRFLLLLPLSVAAFGSHGKKKAFVQFPTSTMLQVSNFLNNKLIPSHDTELPKDVKDAVSKCRVSVQKALEKRLSRMYVEFPVGTKFGVEKSVGKGNKGGRLASAMKDDLESGLTAELLETSDRELARLFVEMFQPVGGENISVVFSDNRIANLARMAWKDDSTAICQILCIDRGKKKSYLAKGMGKSLSVQEKKNKKKQGLAEKLNDEFDDANSGPFKLPKGCEVALFIAPTVKDLIAIKRVCDEVGMGTLVVLLNARLELIDSFGSEEAKQLFLEEFEKVFLLSMAPQPSAPGCLLYRAFPNDWIVARKPKIGQPKTIGTFVSAPTDEQCANAYQSMELGDFEKGFEDVLDSVSSWFK